MGNLFSSGSKADASRKSQSQPKSPTQQSSPPPESTITSPPFTPSDSSSQFDGQWEQKNLNRIGASFDNAGRYLHSLGEMDSMKSSEEIRKGVAKYAKLNANDRKKVEQFRIELEHFKRDLENTLEILEKYSDENKRESRLTFEVKVFMRTFYDWIDMLNNNRVPESFLDDIKAKVKDLDSALTLEALAQQVRLGRQQDMLRAIQMLDKKEAMGIL